jgi:hypothetical protein
VGSFVDNTASSANEAVAFCTFTAFLDALIVFQILRYAHDLSSNAPPYVLADHPLFCTSCPESLLSSSAEGIPLPQILAIRYAVATLCKPPVYAQSHHEC